LTKTAGLLKYKHSTYMETPPKRLEPKKINCPHGKPIQEFCEDCSNSAKINQPSWQTIQKLRETSRMTRDALQVDCEISLEKDTFTIKSIKSKNDPALEELLTLLDKHFKEDTLNSRDAFIAKLEGKTKFGKDRPQYRCFYVRNNEGKMIGLRIAEQFPLEDKEGNETDKNIFYAMYIAIDEEYRTAGVARELYVSSLIDASQEAEKRNKKLDFIIAECSPRTERLQNVVGLKRVYFKKDGQLTEFKYYQPPMKFDPATGEKLSGEPAEHLMLCKMTGQEISKEELFNSVRSLYVQYQNGYPREAFENDQAFEKHQMHYQEIYKNISEMIEQGGELVMLTAEEREQEIEKGTSILNFEDADNR